MAARKFVGGSVRAVAPSFGRNGFNPPTAVCEAWLGWSMGMAPLPREDMSGGTANESPGPGCARCGRGDQCCCSLCSEESHGDRQEGEILEEKKQSISGSVGIKRSHRRRRQMLKYVLASRMNLRLGDPMTITWSKSASGLLVQPSTSPCLPRFPSPSPPQWRRLIASCPSFNCPLFSLKPWLALALNLYPASLPLTFPIRRAFPLLSSSLYDPPPPIPAPQSIISPSVRSQETPNEPHATLNRLPLNRQCALASLELARFFSPA